MYSISKNWWQAYYKQSCMSDRSYGRNVPKHDKVHFKISKFNHFLHTKEQKGKVLCNEFIGGVIPHEVFTIRLPVRSSSQDIIIPSTAAYNDRVPINIKKMNDLKKILQYIPDEKKWWYEEIYTWPTTDQNNEEKDDNVAE
ncbi:hypothetical protein J6590_107089 [Homalodisca vitripennis]|nr:hypothetical protein J6590_107089 [Homalodisca vitripennis]